MCSFARLVTFSAHSTPNVYQLKVFAVISLAGWRQKYCLLRSARQIPSVWPFLFGPRTVFRKQPNKVLPRTQLMQFSMRACMGHSTTHSDCDLLSKLHRATAYTLHSHTLTHCIRTIFARRPQFDFRLAPLPSVSQLPEKIAWTGGRCSRAAGGKCLQTNRNKTTMTTTTSTAKRNCVPAPAPNKKIIIKTTNAILCTAKC